MKHSKLLLITLLFLLTTGFMEGKAAASQPISTITVQGTGQFDVTPDQAEVSISVISTAPTANEAQNDNAKLADNVQKKLLYMNIAKDNIRTAQYSVYPIYNNETDRSNKTPTITGYRITNTITATIDDITTVGNIIDAALSAGANQISGVHFRKKDELQLKQAVLQAAVKEATAKAEAIANALNKHLATPISVSESGVSVQAPEFQRYLVKSADMAANTPITPGTIQVQGSVNVVFEME